jgi:hypothetical protein
MSGRITFEIDETEFVREDNTKQLMEKYKTEVLGSISINWFLCHISKLKFSTLKYLLNYTLF